MSAKCQKRTLPKICAQRTRTMVVGFLLFVFRRVWACQFVGRTSAALLAKA